MSNHEMVFCHLLCIESVYLTGLFSCSEENLRKDLLQHNHKVTLKINTDIDL